MGESYTRKTLYQDDEVEVVDITWQPGAQTEPHDHGESHGIIRVIEGNIEEIRIPQNGAPPEHHVYRKGDIVHETPDLVHIMRNGVKDGQSRTIHAYTPPLRMRTYPIEDIKKRLL